MSKEQIRHYGHYVYLDSMTVEDILEASKETFSELVKTMLTHGENLRNFTFEVIVTEEGKSAFEGNPPLEENTFAVKARRKERVQNVSR